MFTEYELKEFEKKHEGLYDEMERTRKELRELEKEIERTGIGPEDDDYIREELLSKRLAYSYALTEFNDYWNHPKHRRFHAPH